MNWLRTPWLLLLWAPLVFVSCSGSDDDDSAADDDDIFSQDDDDIFSQDDDDAGPDDDDAGPDDDDAGPDDDDSGNNNGGPSADVRGTWSDGDGGSYVISESTWTITAADQSVSSFAVTDFNSTLQYAVAENGASNPEHSGLWSRFEWIPAGAPNVYLCHRVADGESESAAGGVSPADPNSPTTGGCNKDPWILLTPQ